MAITLNELKFNRVKYMLIKVLKGQINDFGADLLILPLFLGKQYGCKFATLDKLLAGALSAEVKNEGFAAQAGKFITVPSLGRIRPKKILLLGLGEKKQYSAELLRRAVASVFGNGTAKKSGKISFDLGEAIFGFGGREAGVAVTEGALLSLYEFSKYKESKHKKESVVKELNLFLNELKQLSTVREGVGFGELLAAASIYARDLVNEPASVCVPAHLAAHARQIAKVSKGMVRVRIFGRDEAKKKGMGAFLAVAAGAEEEPYFIHLSYKPGSEAKALLPGKPKVKSLKFKKITLVGKGITFDSGGLQIKPGESMATMKLDMAGAAAVLGVFSKIIELKPKAEVHGIIAATENMPGPKAYKPGDIVTAMNGKTIEIGHTDAEGRVTLADSLSYAAKLKSDFIIDLATLTGACMVALGEEVTGLMSNNKKLTGLITSAAAESGEKIWELPLVPEYREIIKGTHADVRNSGGTRYGGAIIAGLFLEEFVSGIPWVHLDIAGPAWAEKMTIPYIPLGGTGYGVRTLIRFLKKA